MPLRFRILLILLVVVFVPLASCIYLIANSSYKSNLASSKSYHLTRAQEMNREISSYYRNYANLTHKVVNKSSHFKYLLQPDHRKRAFKGWESSKNNWQQLNNLSPELRWLTSNRAALNFEKLQIDDRHLLSFEVTDKRGFLLSASYKPRNLRQDQEPWWKAVSENPISSTIIQNAAGNDNILEIIGAISQEGIPDSQAAYIRIQVNQASLIADFSENPLWQSYQGLVASPSGKIFLKHGASINNDDLTALPNSLTKTLQTASSFTSSSKKVMAEGPLSMFVFAAKVSEKKETNDSLRFITLSGQTRDSVVMPLFKQHIRQCTVTLGVIILCLLLGFAYMKKTISHPIEEIRSVTQNVSSASQKNERIHRKGACEIVTPLDAIHTGDEIETLAKEFSSMARKVLGFQRKLEEEVESKTKTIQDDLEMAKEFQQALLPQEYPSIDVIEQKTMVSLEFAHAYRPAAAVGGDFFDIVKVDEHRYAALIADVMGHGARSALVTAILRALVDDICHTTPEPEKFMIELNRRFCEIIERSGQTIFVTCCYLLFDTDDATVCACSAGHPSPIHFDHNAKQAHPLIVNQKGTLPLGIMAAAEYQSHCIPMLHNDQVLLYTDGLTEAENSENIQFGERALTDMFVKLADDEPNKIVHDIEDKIVSYSGGTVEDDLCLLLIKTSPTVASLYKPESNNCMSNIADS